MEALLKLYQDCSVDVCVSNDNALPQISISECGVLTLLGGYYKMFIIHNDHPLELTEEDVVNEETLIQAIRNKLIARVDNKSSASTAIRELKILGSKGDPETTSVEATVWTPASTKIASQSWDIEIADNTEQNYMFLQDVQKAGGTLNVRVIICTQQHYYGALVGGMKCSISSPKDTVGAGLEDKQQLLFTLTTTSCVSPNRVKVGTDIITTHLSTGKQGDFNIIDKIDAELVESPGFVIQSVVSGGSNIGFSTKSGVSFASIQVSKRTALGSVSPYEEVGYSGDVTTIAELNTAISNGTTTNFNATAPTLSFDTGDTVLVKYQLTGGDSYENATDFVVT